MQQDLQTDDLFDPNPDIHALFCYYNDIYFEGKLEACTVDWSTGRMTLCAGICKYSDGGGCAIRLSEPLLKYRSSTELKETLLHEMIHAYLWLTNRNKDHDDHGPCFQALMQEINTSKILDHQRPEPGYSISIYHNFTSEVDNYRRHHWKCGHCGDFIKRAMNRPPSQSDCIQKAATSSACKVDQCHWHRHQRVCGGEYDKVAEPAGYQDRRKKLSRSSGKQDAEVIKLSTGKSTKQPGRVKQFSTVDIDDGKRRDKGQITQIRASKTASLEMFYDARKDNSEQDALMANVEIEHSVGDCSDNSSHEEGGGKRARKSKADKHGDPAVENSFKEAIEDPRAVLGKRHDRTPEAELCNRWLNDGAVIIGWKGWCAFEGEEEEKGVEALINNRRQRRMIEKAWECQNGANFGMDKKALEVLRDEDPSTLRQNVTELRGENLQNESNTIPMGLNGLVSHVEELMPVALAYQQTSKFEMNTNVKELKSPQSDNGCTHLSISSNSLDKITVKTDEGMKHLEESGSSSFNMHESRENLILMQRDLAGNPQEVNNCTRHPDLFSCASTSFKCQESVAVGVLCNSLIHKNANFMEVELLKKQTIEADVHESESKIYDIETRSGKDLPVVDVHAQIVRNSGDIGEDKETKTDGKFERRGKRVRMMRGPLRDSDARGPSVTCPICSEVVPGDIKDADFNTQFNEHIDACVNLQFQRT